MASSEELEREIREACKAAVAELERQKRADRKHKRYATGGSFSISVQGRKR